MLEALQRIVRAVSTAANLNEAAAIIVRRVKEAMAADACSIYLVDAPGDHYVLMATEGLSTTAVGRVRIARDQGLVGLVGERQEPLMIEDARAHPRYQLIPESGDEHYRGFLGVPIIHYRKVMGVLIVRRKDAGPFDDNAFAFLVTVAAQLAGAISNAAVDGSINQLLQGLSQGTSFVKGVPGAPGIAIGTIAVVFSPITLESIPDRAVKDPEAEERTFKTAVATVQDELRASGARMASALPSEERALFDAYVMLSGSESIVDDTVGRIRSGSWAPAALRETIGEHARVFERMEDPYLSARANDIRDIGNHILARLHSDAKQPPEYPEGSVLVGEQVSVAQIAEVPTNRLVGIACTGGSSLSHTAILARALGIPAVMGLGHLPSGRLDGREIVVDGHQGRIYIQPAQAVREEYRRLARQGIQLSAELEKLRDVSAETRDGGRVALYVNSGLISDVPAALASGAEGVGLYRTEFAFMVRSSFPGEDEQYRTYRKMLMLFAPKPVNIRTLDIGGDKVLPYFSVTEDNPSLGWRGIRVTLDHPELFMTQLRALLRANAGLNNLSVLLPMVSNVTEVDEALELLERADLELSDEGYPTAKPRLGVMVETPAAACQIAALAKRVEYFSIGTNDLTQHMLAVDRNNPRVANLYKSLHPAVVRIINEVIQEAHHWGKPVSVCGEMAGDPVAAFLLLGMGADILSLGSSELPRIKQVIRGVTLEKARALVQEVLRMEDADAVQSLLREALVEAGMPALFTKQMP